MKKFLRRTVTFLTATILIIGCGNNTKSSSDQNTPSVVSEKPVTVSGMVRIAKKLIKSGTIKVTDTHGKTVVTTPWENSSRFSVEIPAGTTFPVVLTASSQTGELSKKDLKVVVMNPMLTDHIITTNTTAIADRAKELGGYTVENMTSAARSTVAESDRDTTVGGFRGDPTKQFGGWH